MRYVTLAAIAGLFVAAAPFAAVGDEEPIPQDLKKREAQDQSLIQWSRRTIADPYEKIGKNNPRWDAKVRALMELAVKKFSGRAGLSVKDDEVFKAAKAAIDAGCDDPIVLYIHARESVMDNYPGDAEYSRRIVDAAAALAKSQYPPIRRASALVKAAGIHAQRADDATEKKEAARLADAAMALLPESLKADGTSPEAADIWYAIAQEALSVQKIVTGDSQAAFDKVDAALARDPAAKALRLKVRGAFLVEYAWEARGDGLASTVSKEGFRNFTSRLEEARRALDEAWSLRPDDGETAAQRLVVEMGIGEGDRDRMELWFRRAMEADPDNKAACDTKFNWLHPKWHGSFEELAAFGRACRATNNWRSKIPFLLPDVHYQRAAWGPPEERAERNKRLGTPEVWGDIKGVYTEYLKLYPDDNLARSEYAGFAAMCGRVSVAHAQFETLGDHLVATIRFSEEWLKEQRAFCADVVRKAASGTKPPSEE